MKKFNFIPFLFLVFCLQVNAQTPVIKLYAYSRANLSGVNQQPIPTEGGKEIKPETKSSVTYILYLGYTASSEVKVTGVWINQEAFNVKTEKVRKTPVEIPENSMLENSRTITLVPATKQKVLSITVASPINNPSVLTGAKKKAVAESEIVVVYTYRGKKYFKAIKKATVLEPAAAM